MINGDKVAVFGGGCFWCTEAVFQLIDGVKEVVSGYSGGDILNPTYEDICTGSSGHAEVVRITYDSSKVSFKDLLHVFFTTHDPTTLNQQGADKGTQYRSVVFATDNNQLKESQEFINKLGLDKVFSSPVVTQVDMLDVFYVAEDYHQGYFNANPSQGYCQFVIRPKIEKFSKLASQNLLK